MHTSACVTLLLYSDNLKYWQSLFSDSGKQGTDNKNDLVCMVIHTSKTSAIACYN